MTIERVLYFAGILLLSVFTTPLLSVPIAAWYSIKWFAPELLVLGFVIDTYFGAVSAWPMYTIGAVTLIMATRIAKVLLMLR